MKRIRKRHAMLEVCVMSNKDMSKAGSRTVHDAVQVRCQSVPGLDVLKDADCHACNGSSHIQAPRKFQEWERPEAGPENDGLDVS